MKNPLIISLFGLFCFLSCSNSETIPLHIAPKDALLNKYSEWRTYNNKIHKFSFQFPVSNQFEIIENEGLGGEPGTYGCSLIKKPAKYGQSEFNIEVIYTREWSTIGNAFGDVDALEKGFSNGGIEEVANLSRQANLQKESNSPDKQVGNLEKFNFINGTGYGFNLTKTLSFGFTVNDESSGGKVIDTPTNVVFASNGSIILRIEYPANSISIGEQIMPSLRFNN